jgi:hypothetical protein
VLPSSVTKVSDYVDEYPVADAARFCVAAHDWGNAEGNGTLRRAGGRTVFTTNGSSDGDFTPGHYRDVFMYTDKLNEDYARVYSGSVYRVPGGRGVIIAWKYSHDRDWGRY